MVKTVILVFVVSFEHLSSSVAPNRCLADAYLTNSSSRFLPRAEEHKLRFQVEAFRFYQEPRNQVGQYFCLWHALWKTFLTEKQCMTCIS